MPVKGVSPPPCVARASLPTIPTPEALENELLEELSQDVLEVDFEGELTEVRNVAEMRVALKDDLEDELGVVELDIDSERTVVRPTPVAELEALRLGAEAHEDQDVTKVRATPLADLEALRNLDGDEVPTVLRPGLVAREVDHSLAEPNDIQQWPEEATRVLETLPQRPRSLPATDERSVVLQDEASRVYEPCPTPERELGGPDPSRSSPTIPATRRHGSRAKWWWGAGLAALTGVGLVAWSQPSLLHPSPSVQPNTSTAYTPVLPVETVGQPDQQPTEVPRSKQTTEPTAPGPVLGIPWLDGSEAKRSLCTPDAGAKPSAVDERAAVKAFNLRRAGERALFQGDVGGALSQLCEAAGVNPGDASLAREVGRLSLVHRAAPAAELWARRALELDPKDRRAGELLGDALAWQGKIDVARAEWFKTHNITRPNAKIERNLYRAAMREGAAIMSRNSWAKAERLFRRALVFDPKSAPATTEVARALLEQGHAAAAALWIRYALSLGPELGQRQFLAGDIALANGDRKGARRHFERALELEPKHTPARRRLQTLDDEP